MHLLRQFLEKPFLASVATVVLFAVCVMPSENIPNDVNDKAAHLWSFGLLALLWFWVLPKRWLVLLVAVCCFGVLIELVQGVLPEDFHRGFELMDILADGVGASLGILTGYSLKRVFS